VNPGKVAANLSGIQTICEGIEPATQWQL